MRYPLGFASFYICYRDTALLCPNTLKDEAKCNLKLAKFQMCLCLYSRLSRHCQCLWVVLLHLSKKLCNVENVYKGYLVSLLELCGLVLPKRLPEFFWDWCLRTFCRIPGAYANILEGFK